jgi:hypothetical protein
VELVNVTVEVPGAVQAFVAEVPVMATGDAVTVILAVLLADKVLEQVPFDIDETVIVEAPAVVSPVAVNVPEPAVLTVIVAVSPVCDGEEVL